MTVLLGIVYPLVITGIAKVGLSARRRPGASSYQDGTLIGSTSDRPKLLRSRSISGAGRPPPRRSRTTAWPRAGSNLGPLNPALLDAVKANVKALHDADPDNRQPIPVELVTASASGLDPEISPPRPRLPGGARGPGPGLPFAQVQALVAARAGTVPRFHRRATDQRSRA